MPNLLFNVTLCLEYLSSGEKRAEKDNITFMSW